MKFKKGVEYSIDGIVKILMAGERVYKDFNTELVVTSLMDGRHMEGSKHYTGNAADFRIWNFEAHELPYVVKQLKNILGNDYDVVLESTHIHVEYDPK